MQHEIHEMFTAKHTHKDVYFVFLLAEFYFCFSLLEYIAIKVKMMEKSELKQISEYARLLQAV